MRIERRTRLLIALGFAALAVLVLAASLAWPAAKRFDARLLTSIENHASGVSSIATGASHLGDLHHAALFVLALAVVGWAAAGVAPALRALVIVAVPTFVAEILQPLLSVRRTHTLEGTVVVTNHQTPSGHGAFSAALAVAAWSLAPPTARPLLVACGTAYAAAVAGSTLVIGTHFPSDVLAAWAIVAACSIVVMTLVPAPARRSRRIRSRQERLLAIGLVAAVACGIVLLVAREVVTQHGVAVGSFVRFSAPCVAVGLVAGACAALLARRRAGAPDARRTPE